ncbi:MAG TPA: phosphopentomutase [Vicinamibacterales bacterium]|nr:phosphopentomutase [Vicinamibacterales bacterium]
MFARAIVIVLDSVGIGELPDAPLYEDQGSNTLGNIASRVVLKIPTLAAMGLGKLVTLNGVPAPAAPTAAYGRMAEASAGKDSVTGHWELMGVVLDRPFPTFPSGFPKDLIQEFEKRIGRESIGNVVASGTAIIDELGPLHMETGYPIVYTSADSVFQIAAHEGIVPVSQLYKWCNVAYDLAVKGLGLGRVIARPFIGLPGSFQRTSNRHDYAMPPTDETLLDRLVAAGQQVTAVGKVSDLFAGRGISESHPTKSDGDGVERVQQLMVTQSRGLIFANLVDFDTVYGHRNDTTGYAANLERFDARLPPLLAMLRDADVLVITADHGNDPTTPSTDHSREHVPLLVCGPRVKGGVDLGTRTTFADLGQTLAENFGVGPLSNGTSFLSVLRESEASKT